MFVGGVKSYHCWKNYVVSNKMNIRIEVLDNIHSIPLQIRILNIDDCSVFVFCLFVCVCFFLFFFLACQDFG